MYCCYLVLGTVKPQKEIPWACSARDLCYNKYHAPKCKCKVIDLCCWRMQPWNKCMATVPRRKSTENGNPTAPFAPFNVCGMLINGGQSHVM